MTPTTITSLEQYEQELVRVRAEGVAADNEENTTGIICCGGPIFSSAPRPIAALSVSGPTVRMSQNLPAIKEAVKEAVQTISTLLGGAAFHHHEGPPEEKHSDRLSLIGGR